MEKNSNLNQAQKSKNDEFYTKLSDIEKELNLFGDFFKEKVIFMPCDDPELMNNLLGASTEDKASKFWVFFHKNFERLELKKIVAAHYSEKSGAYIISYEGKNDQNIMDFKKEYLSGDGDFRSEEIKKIMTGCDVIVTNPPFSLFREFVKEIVKINKKFIIVGPKNAVTYKDFFLLVKDSKVWLGHNSVKAFDTINSENKIEIKKFGNVGWFTNLPTKKRNELLQIFKNYSSDAYPFFDNYNAIAIDRIKDIPKDYEGEMGVPTSYLDHHNPERFQIVGMDQLGGIPASYVRGKKKFRRIIIRRI